LRNSTKLFAGTDTIICICNHGKERSQKAAEMLYAAGFENTYYLTGGVAGWINENTEIVISNTTSKPVYTLRQLVLYFLKLGIPVLADQLH
jgi:3-mercaptopyruvate sulfurtransferase SseA